MAELPPPPVPADIRESSPIFGSSRLKEAVVEAARKGDITTEEADELFVEYGLIGA